MTWDMLTPLANQYLACPVSLKEALTVVAAIRSPRLKALGYM